MIEPKRVTGLEYIITDFPPKPKREIKYSLVREGSDLYFVNQGSKVIAHVSSSPLGFLTVDDTVYTPEENQPFIYQDILPGEGVLVENYDDERVYNGYTLGLYIYINGEYRIMPRSHKGGVRSQIIMYGDGTTPMYVVIQKKGI